MKDGILMSQDGVIISLARAVVLPVPGGGLVIRLVGAGYMAFVKSLCPLLRHVMKFVF